MLYNDYTMQVICRSDNNFPVLGQAHLFNNIGFCGPIAFDWMLTNNNLPQGTDYGKPNFSHKYDLHNARIIFLCIMSHLLVSKSLALAKAKEGRDLQGLLNERLHNNGDTIILKVFCTVPPSEDAPNNFHYHILGLKKISDTQYQLLDANNQKVHIIGLYAGENLASKIEKYWNAKNTEWPIKDYAVYTLNQKEAQNTSKATASYLKKLKEVHSYGNIVCNYSKEIELLAPAYAIAFYDAFKYAIKDAYAKEHNGKKISIKKLYYNKDQNVSDKVEETKEEKLNRLLVFSACFNISLPKEQELCAYQSMSGLNTALQNQNNKYRKLEVYIKPLNSKTESGCLPIRTLFSDIPSLLKEIQQHGYANAIIKRYHKSQNTTQNPPIRFRIYTAGNKIVSISILLATGIPTVCLASSAICAPEWLLESVLTPISEIGGEQCQIITVISVSGLGMLLSAGLLSYAIEYKRRGEYQRDYQNTDSTLKGASMGAAAGYGILLAGTALTNLTKPDIFINLDPASIRAFAIAMILGIGICTYIGIYAKNNDSSVSHSIK